MATKLSKKDLSEIRKAFTDDAVKTLRAHWGISLVSHYKNGTKVVSPKRAIIIEKLTGISASILRPDIFGRNIKKSA